jgi:hypothetical protein
MKAFLLSACVAAVYVYLLSPSRKGLAQESGDTVQYRHAVRERKLGVSRENK